jgi:hypothetical protein
MPLAVLVSTGVSFVRKVGGLLRFSNNDLQRWIAAQKFQDTKLKKFGS